MVVKVFGPVAAACPQRVLACLLEMGVDFEVVHIDLESREHKRPDFLPRQPFGQVPTIEDGDFRLYESRAIIRYYATNLEDKAVVDQWLEVEAHNFNDLVYTMVLQLLVLPRMGDRTDFGLVQSCAIKLEKVLDVYEQRLSKSTYLAGDAFTLADLSHLPAMRYLTTEAGYMHLVSERKNVNSWWVNISARPAWKKVMHLMA
ncbi:hypothetical protein RJ639_045250 [Escallonia herrerae]|uniref:glutathione transferase n=1 Tax=Escallonia herrerae TaxID=1293975 RepID=A0AA89B1J5_9ASTE|nr:hypothetical protein RJ639_045250 [Escallonia herrerae]